MAKQLRPLPLQRPWSIVYLANSIIGNNLAVKGNDSLFLNFLVSLFGTWTHARVQNVQWLRQGLVRVGIIKQNCCYRLRVYFYRLLTLGLGLSKNHTCNCRRLRESLDENTEGILMTNISCVLFCSSDRRIYVRSIHKPNKNQVFDNKG